MKPTKIFTALLAITVAGGGAVVINGTAASSEDPDRPIMKADLDASSADNVYDAVQELRHGWLTNSAPDRSNPIAFIQLPCMNVTCLRWIEARQVDRIEYDAGRHFDRIRSMPDSQAVLVVTLRTRATGLNPDPANR